MSLPRFRPFPRLLLTAVLLTVLSLGHVHGILELPSPLSVAADKSCGELDYNCRVCLSSDGCGWCSGPRTCLDLSSPVDGTHVNATLMCEDGDSPETDQSDCPLYDSEQLKMIGIVTGSTVGGCALVAIGFYLCYKGHCHKLNACLSRLFCCDDEGCFFFYCKGDRVGGSACWCRLRCCCCVRHLREARRRRAMERQQQHAQAHSARDRDFPSPSKAQALPRDASPPQHQRMVVDVQPAPGTRSSTHVVADPASPSRYTATIEL